MEEGEVGCSWWNYPYSLNCPPYMRHRTNSYGRALRESTILHVIWSETSTWMGDHSLITLQRQKIYMVFRFDMPNVTLWLTVGPTSAT
jgi:hypothetical protein